MAKKELAFIFENPNTSEKTETLLKKIVLEKLLSKPLVTERGSR